ADVPAGRALPDGAVERAPELGDDVDAPAVEAAVGETQGKLRGPAAGDDHSVERGEEWLEVDVPDPGDVAAVRDLVVERHDREGRGAAGAEPPPALRRAGPG